MTYLSDDAIDRLRAAMSAPDLSGTRYRVIEELGRGGMGVVYRAEDTVLARQVALKIVEESEAAEEARIIAALEHPGIVPVHDAGTLPDGRLYYAMKLVEGSPLDRWEASFPARLRTFQKVCEAVAFAHSRSVAHGDLKPSNIMIGAFGEALVLDWGVAALARTGASAGTPGYAAPERGPASAAADVFALGMILRGLAADESTRPAFASIVARATAHTPADRYTSALDLRDEISRYLEGSPVLAHRESLAERVTRLFRRHETAVLLIAAYVVMRLVMLLWLRR
jgi:serine/threonine-protein kinase